LLPFMPGESCLWFWFLEESFLNPVKWLQKRSKKKKVQDLSERGTR